ncbi:MAG TPA: response regulator transcription factor [Tissierellia bacterium]|nr:response regulator transcription factor [Tissierellia bacterium]
MTSTILVCDDDKEINRIITKVLTTENYRTLSAYDGHQVLELAAKEPLDLILLDIMMPYLDGLSALQQLREEQNIPIIILSAKSQESDKVRGLSLGADDYITKPFSNAELLARVKSALRRYKTLGDVHQQKQTEITIGDLSLDMLTKMISVGGETIHLTATEYKIMEHLMRHAGQVFSAEQIYEQVWGEPAYGVENTVMVHIRRIREKIEINPKEPIYLKVVWGIGYKIEA